MSVSDGAFSVKITDEILCSTALRWPGRQSPSGGLHEREISPQKKKNKNLSNKLC